MRTQFHEGNQNLKLHKNSWMWSGSVPFGCFPIQFHEKTGNTYLLILSRWRLAKSFITIYECRTYWRFCYSGCGATFSQVFHVLPVTLWSLINYNSLDPFRKTVECQFACILKPALALALVYIVIRLVRRKLMSKKWKARFSSLECVDVIIEKYLVDPVKTGRWRMFRV